MKLSHIIFPDLVRFQYLKPKINPTMTATITTPQALATVFEMLTRAWVMSGSLPPMSLNIFSNVGTTNTIIAMRMMITRTPIAIG